MIQYETKRLILREWQDCDFGPFSALNQDHDVMEYLSHTYSNEDNIEVAAIMQDIFNANGFGFYTARLKDTGEYVGCIGLHIPHFEAHFMPCVEVAWRVAKKFWGQGLAVEGAKKSLEIGFTEFGLNEIVTFASKINTKSIRVMQKLGMTHDPLENFNHPDFAPEDPLYPHVLYRMPRSLWLKHQS